MNLEKSVFFENFNRNLRKILKIPELLPFFSRINPYKENQYNEANGILLDKQWVVWYRELTVWAIDVHINGFFVLFILWAFSLQSLSYTAGIANGLIMWIVPHIISLLLKPFVSGAKDIVNELPRK